MSTHPSLHHTKDLLYILLTQPPTTGLYTLSLHDALPIFATGAYDRKGRSWAPVIFVHKDNPISRLTLRQLDGIFGAARSGDRKSTRLNSSHQIISYAVFCLKKKK